jgi:hypothetical protein
MRAGLQVFSSALGLDAVNQDGRENALLGAKSDFKKGSQ